MNIYKIQSDLLKRLVNQKIYSWFWGEVEIDGDKFIGISEGHCIWLIPEKLFFLNLAESELNKLDMTKFFMRLQNDIDGIRTGVTKECIIEGKMTSCAEIQGKGVTCYVNAEFLKPFSKPTFLLKDEKSAITVLENGITVGMILPINMKAGDRM